MGIDNALAKKRKIYGVDPNVYETEVEFHNVVNERILEVCSFKIKNITRHIDLCEKKYKSLLGSKDRLVYDMFFGDRSSEEYQDFRDYLEQRELTEKIMTYDLLLGFIINMRMDKKSLVRILVNGVNTGEKESEIEHIVNKYFFNNPKFEELIKEYMNFIYWIDLNSEKGIFTIIDYVRKEILPLPEMHYNEDFQYCKKDDDILYVQVMNEISSSNIDFHPIFNCNDKSGKYTSAEKKAIDLLLQISALKKQLEYYLAIKESSNNAITEYISRNNSWGAIMQNKYWIRLGRDPYRRAYHSTINLFMIKPGTKTFDENNIRYFIRRKDKKFEQEYKSKCNMLLVTIPNSLEENSLLSLIDFVYMNGTNIKFVCESSNVADKIKSILIQKELLARVESKQPIVQTATSNQKYYIKGYYWLYIDSNYYNSFFVSTPNNKNIWNRYDANIDLNTLIDICILHFYEESLSLEDIIHMKCDLRLLGGDCFRYNNSLIANALDEERKQEQSTFNLVRKLPSID